MLWAEDQVAVHTYSKLYNAAELEITWYLITLLLDSLYQDTCGAPADDSQREKTLLAALACRLSVLN
jgi:hypothetical protein